MKVFQLWFAVVLVFVTLQELQSQDSVITRTESSIAATPSWTFYRLRRSDMLALPGRTNQYYLPLLPGIVEFNNDLHIRGSRSYENAYVLTGFNVTNPVTNTNGFELIPEATESIEVHTGPAGASVYSTNGGVIESQMREGGEELQAFAEFRTDDIVKPGASALGTVPLGVKNVVATFGGPAFEGVRFFFAGQYRYVRNDQAIFLEPFHFEGLTDDGFQGWNTRGRLLVAPDTNQNGIIDFKRNYLPNNYTESTSFNGNVSLDLQQLVELPLGLKILGTYNSTSHPGGKGWPEGLYEYYRPLNRQYVNATESWMISAQLKHTVAPGIAYNIGVSYQSRFAETYDPNFVGDFYTWLKIPDSLANARAGFNTSEWMGRYFGPRQQSTIYNFVLAHPESPNNSYTKDKQTGFSLRGDVTTRIDRDWTVQIGGSYSSWALRRYTFGSIRYLLSYLDQNQDGDFSDAPTFASEYEKRIRYLNAGYIVTWGYTYLGEETDGYTLQGSSAVLDRPYEPAFGSAYGEALYSTKGVSLRMGIRYEYIDAGLKTIAGKTASGRPDFDNVPYDLPLGMMDESQIVKTDPLHLLLPRLSISIEALEGVLLRAAYGNYAQMPPYGLLMQSNLGFSQNISPFDRSPYSFGYGPAFKAKPERSTQYELGATVPIMSRLSASMSLYYKTLNDQLQLARYYDDAGNWIMSVRGNEGYGITKGLEVSANLERTNGFALSAHYSISIARGLTSNPVSNVIQVTDGSSYPTVSDTLAVPAPYDYEQVHRASLIADYRTTDNAGQILGNIGITAVLSFNSGHPFTREAPLRNLGSSNAWTIGVRSLFDPRSQEKLEPTNSSETPNVINLDLRISKQISIGPVIAEVYLSVLNVLNTKHIVNVYPYSGTTTGDAWYRANPYYYTYAALPLYEPFYEAINIQNRYSYIRATGNDLYGLPREFRIGLSVRY